MAVVVFIICQNLRGDDNGSSLQDEEKPCIQLAVPRCKSFFPLNIIVRFMQIRQILQNSVALIPCIQLPVLGFRQVEFKDGIYTTHLLAASRIILIITTGDTCLE